MAVSKETVFGKVLKASFKKDGKETTAEEIFKECEAKAKPFIHLVLDNGNRSTTIDVWKLNELEYVGRQVGYKLAVLPGNALTDIAELIAKEIRVLAK